MFKAIYLEQVDGKVSASLRELDDDTLVQNTADADVVIDVDFSTINYKDGLAIARGAPVVRRWPMVPGIDLAGVVRESADPDLRPGARVVLNGWGVGEGHWGGLAQRARLKSEWLIPLPDGMGSRQAMAIGTAGYTAMLCVMQLERNGVRPGDGEVLVTGAAGGVGSVATSLLSARGYRVAASTGRLEEADYLRELGATEVLDRAQLAAQGKPLQRERWAGVIDSVGSYTLANACAQTRYRGTVVACGLAQGMDFPATVAPFILRGVRLIGVDSVMCPREDRIDAWQNLARELSADKLTRITTEIGLGQVIESAGAILGGRIRGRLVVDVNA
ncbi:MAG: MDR family oxidoreductase [Burkholderiaceae bacterium]